MKLKRASGAAALLLLAAAGAPVHAAEPTEAAVKSALVGYEEAWSRQDAATVASFYYEPAMRVSKGGPTVRATRADQQAFFDGFLRGLVERGYARSLWESLDVRLLDDQTAIASGVTVRLRTDGSEFERAGVTYALRNTPNGWEIFMSATHAPDKALRFR
jgi:ketosteroid isomerase-like protein